ncbi:MAG: hypothetical protein HYX75_08545 [Acidobacteria bacterium]|nr:hypothetical protein [Acidobacteriota bacterium]
MELEPPFHVYIVGLGIYGFEQVTREVERALRQCKSIYYVDPRPAAQIHLPGFCPRTFNLRSEYADFKQRSQTYEEMAERTLMAASLDPPVALALYGHPLYGATPTQILLKRAHERGLRTKVFPGISSLDVLMVLLGLDPVVRGLQIYEANDLLLRHRPLQQDVPCLILQIGSVESFLAFRGKNRPRRFELFKRHLLQFYPSSHELMICRAAPDPCIETMMVPIVLSELETAYEELTLAATLYIAPVQEKPRDSNLLRLMTSQDHLRQIVFLD